MSKARPVNRKIMPNKSFSALGSAPQQKHCYSITSSARCEETMGHAPESLEGFSPLEALNGPKAKEAHVLPD